ncbi:MAG: hypothetical protein IRZ03_12775 [Acidobacterium ailaaui]|jgi:hypothetical protein|nr:hypothetical protein [Pseudacidobacterium ailaaui]
MTVWLNQHFPEQAKQVTKEPDRTIAGKSYDLVFVVDWLKQVQQRLQAVELVIEHTWYAELSCVGFHLY